MARAKLRINISFDVSDALKGFRDIKEKAFPQAIEAGIEQAAAQLIKDCRPYIPLLTGKLRDSGHLEQQLKDYAFVLIWDAANPINGYVYVQKQYEEVLQHVDGRYAAEWVEKTLDANEGRYTFLAARFVRSELQKVLG